MMKKITTLSYSLILLFFFLFMSCGEDRAVLYQELAGEWQAEKNGKTVYLMVSPTSKGFNPFVSCSDCAYDVTLLYHSPEKSIRSLALKREEKLTWNGYGEILPVGKNKFILYDVPDEGDILTFNRIEQIPTFWQETALGISGDYPEASTRLLQWPDARGLSKQELRIARNEIFARQGYTFKSEDLQAHFGAQPWYRPEASNASVRLSSIEKVNVQYLKALEEGVQPQAWIGPVPLVEEANDTRKAHSYEEKLGLHLLASRDFLEFWYRFQAAVSNNQAEEVAKMVTYPFVDTPYRAYDQSVDFSARNAREFADQFRSMFTPEGREYMSRGILNYFQMDMWTSADMGSYTINVPESSKGIIELLFARKKGQYRLVEIPYRP